MGWDRTFPKAFLKAQMGAGTDLPDGGRVVMSIKDADQTGDLRAAASITAVAAMKVRTEGEIGLRTKKG